jgi:hypothetical protein
LDGGLYEGAGNEDAALEGAAAKSMKRMICP